MDLRKSSPTSSLLFKELSKAAFLSDYWQTRAYFFSGVFSSVIPSLYSVIDGDELAGMACEEAVESRIIFGREHAGHWQCEYGAFTEERLTSLPDNDWTLLVQGVDQWCEEACLLLSHFDFLPRWRLEDIMASYAPVGGGVGPHFDYYDVFLVQVSGRREWQLGQQCDENTPLKTNSDVKLLETFDSTKTYIAEPGDVLYIPAGRAHWGTAMSDDCITFSVGFRAPSQKELMEKILENIIDECAENQRYQDPISIQTDVSHSAKITQAMQKNVTQLINNVSPEIIELAAQQAFGTLVTEPRYHHLDDELATDSNTKELLEKRLLSSEIIDVHIPVSTRMAFSATHLFVNANSYRANKYFSQHLCEGYIHSREISENEKSILFQLLNNADILLQ